VVLGFVDEPPSMVKLGYRVYRTRLYVSEPIQCHRRLGYGRVQAKCRSAARCPRCGDLHEFDNCPHRDDLAHAKCIHCGENHSSKFGGCKRRKEVRTILHTAAEKKLSYADAVKAVRAVKRTETQPISTKPTTSSCNVPVQRQSVATDASFMDMVIKEATVIIEKEIKQLKQTLERNITETFDKMKSCMIELKKAVEADMDRMDEVIQQTCVTEDGFWYELHNQARTIYQVTQDMVGLHEATLGKKQPSDKYISCWDNLIGNNGQLAELVNHLAKNVRTHNESTDRTAENC